MNIEQPQEEVKLPKAVRDATEKATQRVAVSESELRNLQRARIGEQQNISSLVGEKKELGIRVAKLKKIVIEITDMELQAKKRLDATAIKRDKLLSDVGELETKISESRLKLEAENNSVDIKLKKLKIKENQLSERERDLGLKENKINMFFEKINKIITSYAS